MDTNILNSSDRSLLSIVNDEDDEHTYNLTQSLYYTDAEMINILQNKTTFTVISLNCQSIAAKFDELKYFIEDLMTHNCYIDVINLQETWQGSDTYYNDFTLHGYDLYFQPAICSTHGGLITYVKTSLTSTLHPTIYEHSTSWEGMFIEIENLNKSLIIGNIYRPPRESNEQITKFNDEFNKAVHHKLIQGKKMIISGDFNINLLKINEKIMYANFFDMMTSISLLPNITYPTRITRTTATIIDNIFSNSLEDTVLSGIITNKSISDHQIIFSSFDNFINIKKQSNKIKNIKIIDYAGLKNEISQTIYTNLNKALNFDPNQNYNVLENKLAIAINKHTTIKKRKLNKFNHKKNPWITQGLIKSIQFRDKLHLKSKCPGLTLEEYQTIKINIKTYNTIIKRLIRKLKRKFLKNKFEEHKSNLKKTWQLINDVMGRDKRDTTSDLFIINQEEITDPKLIADHFNEFFVNIASASDNNEFEENGFKTYLNAQHSYDEFHFDLINNQHTTSIISHIKTKYSYGYDEISSALLKIIMIEISPSLTLIINQCLTTGIFPDNLKIAKIIPIYKKGNSKLIDNYRPISLLPTISRIFETAIYSQLYEYFELHHIITDSQYGFRKSHSTIFTATELIDRLTNKLDNKKTPFNIYIDLSKAFDTIDHSILLSKLHYYGIRNTALTLLKSYFTNRKQYCHYKGTNSTMRAIYKGVPQGSILGPLLFILYVNDFHLSSNKFTFLMYADDTTLLSTYDTFYEHTDTDITSIQRNINKELLLVTTWLARNKLLINSTKTKMTIFHTQQKQITYPDVKIDNTRIEIVDDFKLLGITINKHLKWHPHVENTAIKVSKYIGVLNRLKHTLPPRILYTLYNTLILPHFNYGLLLWGHENTRLHRLQKRAIRTITNSKYNSHTEPLCKVLNIIKLPDLYKLELYKLYYKIQKEQVPYYFTTVINPLTHNYNTRREAVQQLKTTHTFAQHTCIFSMIHLINKSPQIKLLVTTCHSITSFTISIKYYILDSYQVFCSVRNCYACNSA